MSRVPEGKEDVKTTRAFGVGNLGVLTILVTRL
jgi:hypothetical protein